VTTARAPAWLDSLDSLLARHDDRLPKLDALRRGILGADGALDLDVRRAAFAGEPVPEPLQGYVDKVRRHAYRVTDEDVAALRAAGWSEEQVFELTVAASVGAAFERLHAGLRALGEVD
jgi:alkylhydroperoxidase family enzyme